MTIWRENRTTDVASASSMTRLSINGGKIVLGGTYNVQTASIHVIEKVATTDYWHATGHATHTYVERALGASGATDAGGFVGRAGPGDEPGGWGARIGKRTAYALAVFEFTELDWACYANWWYRGHYGWRDATNHEITTSYGLLGTTTTTTGQAIKHHVGSLYEGDPLETYDGEYLAITDLATNEPDEIVDAYVVVYIASPGPPPTYDVLELEFGSPPLEPALYDGIFALLGGTANFFTPPDFVDLSFAKDVAATQAERAAATEAAIAAAEAIPPASNMAAGKKGGGNHWFNNDWSDWINPAAWVASIGHHLGDRIGAGWGAMQPGRNLRDFSVARQNILYNEILDPRSNITGSQVTRELQDILGDGLRETGGDAWNMASGAVALAELGLTVHALTTSGLSLLQELQAARGTAPSVARSLPLPKTDPTLVGTDILGYTTANGTVFLRPGLSWAERLLVLRHEAVHVFLSVADKALFARIRQRIAMWGYSNSHLLRFVEEALAEGTATRSVVRGLVFPIVNPYDISIPRLLIEAGAVGAGMGGLFYGGWLLGGGGD